MVNKQTKDGIVLAQTRSTISLKTLQGSDACDGSTATPFQYILLPLLWPRKGKR